MFEVTGTEQIYKVTITQLFEASKKTRPEIKPEMWDEIENEFSTASLDDLEDMLVPVYEKYLTQKDLEELIKLFLTPIGQKYVKSTPFIMREAFIVGQQWGKKIEQDLEKKIKEKGL